MTEKRFTVVMNEFDEVEYITDIVDCEDRDFADFIDFANEMAKENEELKKENDFAKLLANHRGEMVTFANSLIQDIDNEEYLTQKMWYQFKEEMYQKWKKKRDRMTQKQMFMSPLRWGNTIIQKTSWDLMKCKNCGGELELIINNKFEEIKQCKDCDKKFTLVKKLRKEVKE